MTDVIILQRVVADYRLPIYERLWEEFGWTVVTSSEPPSNTYLNLIEGQYEFIKRYRFRFPDPGNPFRCDVPLHRILAETGAKAVISEFSLRMSSTYELVTRRRFFGSPITIFWSHGYNMSQGLTTLRKKIMQWPRFLLARMGDGHICYSAEGKTVLERYMPAERIFVARNTIDIANFQALARRIQPSPPPGKPSILAIGRLTHDKEFPRLVRVFHSLRTKFPEAVLTIIGDGPETDRTRETAGKALGRSVLLLGELYDQLQLAHHFRSADLVVIPGAAGLSVNHALAYGVPVMAFDRTPDGPHHHPEIAYVIDNVTGYRIPRYSDEALLEGLLSFFSQHEDPKEDFKESIAHFVAENLTLNVMVEDFRKVSEYLRTLGVDSGKRPLKFAR